MALYELTNAAEADIEAIAQYTITTWGMEQARRYEVILESHLAAIGRQKARTRLVFKHRPDLFVSRIQHHYVFIFCAKSNVRSFWRCFTKTWI